MDRARFARVHPPEIGAWLTRVRWRRRGAWLWPAFVALTAADAVIGHELPPLGDTQQIFAAALLGGILNLLGVVLLTWPLSLLIRRLRADLPVVVARDYAGTLVVSVVTAALLAAGLVHHSVVVQHRDDLWDASTRAEAWIGVHAPAQFRHDAADINTFTIEAGRLYRSCVTIPGGRSYCAVVKLWLPAARSVSFAGYEPNSVFATGVG